MKTLFIFPLFIIGNRYLVTMENVLLVSGDGTSQSIDLQQVHHMFGPLERFMVSFSLFAARVLST